MGSLVLGGFDIVGDDEDDGYEVGRGPALARRRGGGKVTVPTPRWMNATTSQGVSRPQEEMDYLPFVTITIAAGGTTGTLLCNPQRPFRGERLLLGAINVTAGTDAANNATIDPCIFVGATVVGAALGGTPFATFKADAFGVRLSFPPVGQGTVLRIPVILLAAAPSGGVACTATLIGRAMR